jgi:putative drug exporter of the RND superfamily
MKFSLGTEGLARACAKRPWLTIGIWAGVLAVAVVLISTLLGGALTNENKMTNLPESAQASQIMEQRLGKTDNLDENVIIAAKNITVDDPLFKAQVEELYADMAALGPQVFVGGATYYSTNNPVLVSADRHSTMIAYQMPKDGDKHIEAVYSLCDRIAKGGVFQVYNTGNASFNHDANALAENTMKTGESVGIAVALVVLALVFGAVVAATLPVILGIVAIVAAMGLSALVGQAMDLSFTITNLITMMGLAVGIDYSLFILTRFREERRKGLNKLDAIGKTGATATRAVLFSGVTVLLALTSLVVFPLMIFQSMGIGSILVVATTLLATLTLLPAVLSLFGDRVNALRIPFLRSSSGENGNDQRGFWATTTRLVTRQPVVSIVLVIVVMGCAIIPFFSKQSGMSGISGLPDSLRAKQGFNYMVNEFHLGMDSPAIVVIDGDSRSAAAQTAIAGLQEKIATNPAFSGSQVASYPDKNLTVIYAGLQGDPLKHSAMNAVSELRSRDISEAFAGSGLKPLVTGQTAFIVDFNQVTDDYTPWVFAAVLTLSFLILMVAFRSIVIPFSAILMNMLSVGAAYGLMVLVFQKGVGASLFGFQQVDAIETWLPIFLFALLFGLSMDYHVFLLSRIREKYQQNGNNSEAVSFGLRSTGQLITGAALIMVAVFGGFALGDMVMFQQMGFGLAVAVLLDATLIRTILVPATMKLLGKANWYLPRWLNWIPNISLGENSTQKAPEQPRRPAMMPGQAMGIPVAIPVAVRIDENGVRDQRSKLNP